MKKIVFLFLAVALTACAAPATEQPAQPTVAPPEPTTTPIVIVETVIVIATHAPTEVPPPTAIPPTTVQPTAIPPTRPPAPPAEVVAPTVAGGPVVVDNALGGGWFVNMPRAADAFSFRRQLSKDITFSVTPADASITEVNLY